MWSSLFSHFRPIIMISLLLFVLYFLSPQEHLSRPFQRDFPLCFRFCFPSYFCDSSQHHQYYVRPEVHLPPSLLHYLCHDHLLTHQRYRVALSLYLLTDALCAASSAVDPSASPDFAPPPECPMTLHLRFSPGRGAKENLNLTSPQAVSVVMLRGIVWAVVMRS